MADLTCSLTLEIRHPLIAPDHWSVLPSRDCEDHLRKNRLRLRLAGERLVFWGEAAASSSGIEPEKPLSFFLFCSDPYFLRCSEVPLIRPGREFLEVILSGEGQSMEARACGEDFVREMEKQRKRHQGTGFGPPPVARVNFPAPEPARPRMLKLEFLPRLAYWSYEITPRPPVPVAIAGPCPFTRLDEADGLAFTSDDRLSMAPPFPKISLLLTDGNGPAFPLMENLAAPSPGQMVWDPERGTYTGVVRLDLRHFGIVF